MSIEQIQAGTAIVGIEFGSTRIKSVLIDSNHEVIASGSHEWENDYVNGIWTYSQEAIISGLQSCFADPASEQVQQETLKRIPDFCCCFSSKIFFYVF